MSIGEDRVRIKFNPSDNTAVNQIKQKTAELIDIMHIIGAETDDPERKRLFATAMTRYEEASMWAVKAATMENK